MIRTVCHDTNRDTNHSTLCYELQLRTATSASRLTMAPFVAHVMSKSYQVRILFGSEYIVRAPSPPTRNTNGPRNEIASFQQFSSIRDCSSHLLVFDAVTLFLLHVRCVFTSAVRRCKNNLRSLSEHMWLSLSWTQIHASVYRQSV